MPAVSNSKTRAIVVTNAAIAALARPPGLHAAPSLMLWHFARELPIGGAHVNMSALASELGISTVHASKSIRTLLEAGFIVRGPKDGMHYHYSLNPAYFHLL